MGRIALHALLRKLDRQARTTIMNYRFQRNGLKNGRCAYRRGVFFLTENRNTVFGFPVAKNLDSFCRLTRVSKAGERQRLSLYPPQIWVFFSDNFNFFFALLYFRKSFAFLARKKQDYL